MSGTNRSAVRLTLIGPMPPPVHGQAVVMSRLVTELRPRFPRMKIADTHGGHLPGWARVSATIRESMNSLRAIRSSDAVYIAVKAGRGMWLTTIAAGLARISGAQVLLHHHSYAYIRERKLRMVALTRFAGPRAYHVVLSRSMASDLRTVMPEVQRILVIGNAVFVDQALLDIPLRADSAELILGHLSNLGMDKGLDQVVNLAAALHKLHVPVKLIIGGPTSGQESRQQLDRAADALGDRFEYRGPLTGESKSHFFQDITHFVFPSRYVHEAVPLVLYEAMASGAMCVTTRQGAIPEQLEGSPALLASSTETFVDEALPALATAAVSAQTSHECRQSYLRALADSERQLSGMVEIIADLPRLGRS